MMMKHQRKNHKQIRELIEAGMSNKEIKQIVGCSDGPITALRKEIGIKSPMPFQQFKNDVLVELIKSGLNNKEIVERIDVGESTVKRYRSKLNIRSPYKKPYDKEQIIKLVQSGLSNHEIVEEIGCSSALISVIRGKLGIKDPKRRGASQKWYAYEVDELLKQGKTYNEVMKATGASAAAVWSRKKALGLIKKDK